MSRAPYAVRALMLALRLQQHSILYTPRSHHGRRAARLLPKLRKVLP
jgi:hypothetical protein